MKLTSWKLMVPAGILLVLVMVTAASSLGLINYKGLLGKIPLLKQTVLAGKQENKGTGAPSYDRLQQQNDALNKQVATLKEEANVNLSKQLNVPGNNGGSNTGGMSSSGGSGVDQTQQGKTRKLADYYAGMKPAAAVAIFNNQDPQMVAGILHEMDQDQASQILSAMDPAQAAKLIGLIANLDTQSSSSTQQANP